LQFIFTSYPSLLSNAASHGFEIFEFVDCHG
jgi:hypothetical protein